MRRRLLGRIFLLVFLLTAFQSGRIFYAQPFSREAISIRDLSIWTVLVATCLVSAVWALVSWWRRRQPRGAQLVPFAALKAHCDKREGEILRESLFFGGIDGYSPEAATSHFFLAGTTGSGKTLSLTMMMAAVLPSIWKQKGSDGKPLDYKSLDRRAVIFDVKQDMISTLLALDAPASHLTIFNPFDARCTAWDVASDISGPDTALQLATILIPDNPRESNRYFSDAARDLLCGAIQVFIERSANWQLADLVLAMRTPERLRQVLSLTQRGRDLIALHLETPITSLNILSMARTRLAPFEVVAALWKQAANQGRMLSLKTFLKEPGVLVLGNNQSALAPIQAINRVIFRRLTELLLDQGESADRRTWFFLDEARKIGKLDGLDDLMTNGRSKGACVVLGFQDIAGMREVYGQHVAEEILGMCGSVGILKISGATTPQWASTILGEREEAIHTRGSSATEMGRITESEGENWGIRPLLLPSQFRSLPRPEKGKPLYGYFRSAFIENPSFRDKVYKAEISPTELTRRLPSPTAVQRALNYMPWTDGNYKYLNNWKEADYVRLNLPFSSGKAHQTPRAGGELQEQFVDPFTVAITESLSRRKTVKH
jgi:hypothetical protein